MSKYIVTRANILLFFVLISILLLVGGVTWDRFSATNASRALVRHTYEVIGGIKDLELAIRDAEVGQLGFLLTGDRAVLEPSAAAAGQMSLLQGALQHLTADNPTQQERLRSLAPMLQRKLDQLAQTEQLRQEGRTEEALRLMASSGAPELGKAIDATLTAMSQEEDRLLEQRLAMALSRSNSVLWLVGAMTLLASAMLLWAARMLNRAWSRSQRMEAEQRLLAVRLRTSLDSLSQGIAVFNTDWLLTHWNDCFHVLLELPAAMVRSETPYAAFYQHLADGPVPLLESEDQVRHGPNVAGEPVVYTSRRRDGAELEVRRMAVPDGGFVLTITDMTKRAQAEAVLRESQKMQAIGQLTGGIAHDFNNLLTVVLGNLEFIRTKPSDEQRLQTRLERAIWAAERGASLTRQLLAFARKQPLAPTALNLGATMPELIPLLRRTLGETIEVRYVEVAGLWPAMADAAQLESAVLNLALNARDAMPEGGRLTIELANKVLDAEYAARHAEVIAGDYTMLAVSDTGHGMTPEVMARVFEPFFTTKPDGKGTGLGLAMVFGFVKQSGGHVKLYSEPGEGTTVRIYLPRAVGAVASVRQRSAEPVELPRGSATILVVEDEAGVREIAVAILRDLGYRVLQAADGDEALLVFGAQQSGIDLLLTDVVLSGRLRGRELAERIKAIRPDVSVLYMSGYTENSIVHNGRLDDGVHLISKPFQREQLARKVAEVLAANTTSAPALNPDENVVELKQRRGD